MKERIKYIMDREQMTSGAFAESIGIQQSTLSHILKGRNNPSLDVVMKIHQRFNYINLEWLLYNKGSVTNDSSDFPENRPSLFDENELNMSGSTEKPEYPKEIALITPQNNNQNIVKQEIKYVEKPVRKITEIRIFFDDNTYEVFHPEK